MHVLVKESIVSSENMKFRDLDNHLRATLLSWKLGLLKLSDALLTRVHWTLCDTRLGSGVSPTV